MLSRTITLATHLSQLSSPLVMTLALMVLCFSVFTVVAFGVFVKHYNTLIVKANNWNLSYILLISLMFCFLWCLLFIGHPSSDTCTLQQITFWVVLSTAVYTVLATTITVLVTFTMMGPERKMRYLLISEVPNYISTICTLIQTILCAFCLRVSSPSIDIDAYSEHDHIIIFCDKDSVNAFYSVLGYHVSLPSRNFIVAFLVWNPSHTFNKDKLFTFRMLLFCNVCVNFLLVYHSTKGYVMLVVQVFSILVSSTGLLGYILITECYKILLRTEINSLLKLKEKVFSGSSISWERWNWQL